MAGPPESVPASDLFRLLQELPRPSEVVDFPRKLPGTDDSVGQLVMWPLSQNEQMAANAEADRFAKKILKESPKRDEASLGYDSIYANEVAVQVLYRACRDVTDPKRPMFPSPAALRELSADEVGALFLLYCEVQVKLGPVVSRMSEEEMEAWVVQLADGGKHVPFSLLSLDSQLRLVSFMASQIVNFSTDTSSAGSPQDEVQTEESAEPSS
jgi:hypothetical protein